MPDACGACQVGETCKILNLSTDMGTARTLHCRHEALQLFKPIHDHAG